jgi:hypothetical protein
MRFSTRGTKWTWRYDVDTHARAAPFAGQILGKRDHAGLARAIGVNGIDAIAAMDAILTMLPPPAAAMRVPNARLARKCR